MKLNDLQREELLAAAAEEMTAARAETITVEFSLGQAMGLLATLQLATRHPKFTGPTSTTMRNLAHVLQAGLENCGPATAKLCELGWNPEEDIE